jgi:hypothetical protein
MVFRNEQASWNISPVEIISTGKCENKNLQNEVALRLRFSENKNFSYHVIS